MPLSWVEIDLEALRHNFSKARERLAPETAILGVVKSDAYGHGMVPVARELAARGVHFLGVSKFWEAAEIRASGVDIPILTLLGLEPSDMETAVAMGIRPAIFRVDHAERLNEAAVRLNRPAPVHLKIDTGMGRLGVPCDRVAWFLSEFRRFRSLQLEGVLSHFSVADEADKSFSHSQLDRFRTALQTIVNCGFSIRYAHIANSAGLMDLPQAHFQLVRPGIMLYGSPPSQDLLHPTNLKPVMCFKSRILQLKEVPAGHPIGYGKTYTTQNPSRIASIPVGYDDGYPRLLSNRGHVLVRGQRAPVVGRVSMNITTVDVTRIPDAREDDEVVLLGAQGGTQISADEIAGLCGTISYEIYCSIGRHRFKYFLNPTVSTLAPCPGSDI